MKIIKSNLFLIGAAKSGTSSLHDQLSFHKEICGIENKEPHFFCKTESEIYCEVDDYLNKFHDEGCLYYLDSSTGYLQFENSIENIVSHTESAKFIIILRNPIDRVLSHYNWLFGYGDEEKGFWDAINEFGLSEPGFDNGGATGYKNYISWGMYGKKVTNLFKLVDKKNVKIVFFEDYKTRTREILREIFYFLDIEVDDDFLELASVIKSNESVSIKNKKIYQTLSKIGAGGYQFPLKKYLSLMKRNLLSIAKSNKENSSVNYTLSSEERVKLAKIYYDDVMLLSSLIDKKIDDMPWPDFQINRD